MPDDKRTPFCRFLPVPGGTPSWNFVRREAAWNRRQGKRRPVRSNPPPSAVANTLEWVENPGREPPMRAAPKSGWTNGAQCLLACEVNFGPNIHVHMVAPVPGLMSVKLYPPTSPVSPNQLLRFPVTDPTPPWRLNGPLLAGGGPMTNPPVILVCTHE